MRLLEKNARGMAAIAALAMGLGAAGIAVAQTASGEQRYGDSASLSSGMPIEAPTTVDGGQTVTVGVQNPREGARIELWGPVTQSGKGSQVTASPLAGGTVQLTAPEVSGSYELRYVDGSGALLGRRAFDVAAVPVALTVPTPVGVGGTMEVTWQGPASAGDRFEMVSDTGAVAETTPVAGNAFSANVSQLAAPQQPGSYELRYVTASGAVLRTVRFDVR